MKLDKLNGWHRLWILLSIIYFGVVASYVILSFPKSEHPILQENYKMEKVTNNNGEKGFYDKSIGFVPLSAMEKATYNGKKGFYAEKTGFVPLEILALSEEDRLRLDEIIERMITNKESEENIQWVVNDFKQKYGTNPIMSSGVENGPWKDYRRIVEQKTTEKRLHLILYAFLLWLIPCLTLYALGWSISWIYKGFKQKKDAQQ